MNSIQPNIIPDTTNVPDTAIGKIRMAWGDMREDFRGTDLRGKMYLGSLALMTAYEWGPGNETVTPLLGTQAIDMAGGVGGALLTGAVTGGFTFAQQLSSSWLSRHAVEEFPKTTETAFTVMNGQDEAKNRFKKFDELSPAKQVAYSVGLGSSFNVLRESAVTGSTDQEQLRRVGRKSAAITAGLVSVVAVAADVVDQAAPEGSAAQGVIEVIKSPLFWVGAMGVLLSKDYIKSHLPRRNRTEKPAPTEAQ